MKATKSQDGRLPGGQQIRPALAAVIVLVLSLNSLAQSPADRWHAVQQLLPGDEIAVRMKDQKSLKGKVAGVTDTVLKLSREGRIDDLARSEIKRVYWLAARQKRTQQRWAGVGAIAGFLGGVFTTVSLSENTDAASKAVAGIAIIGGLLGGALLGWKLGSRQRKVLVYEVN